MPSFLDLFSPELLRRIAEFSRKQEAGRTAAAAKCGKEFTKVFSWPIAPAWSEGGYTDSEADSREERGFHVREHEESSDEEL